ncbi:hypothetical protein PCASD_11254 [Puccinia coronata f. sp. avenae]|uniref:No apical meristem-associated C-terminal domain-containing protein n=1 Tax=Puccinia coronata f. sp. avenae TaxID=200324 RepID=A0A2N5UJ11_9BASI|nr:hypothetical protein PCASD_11254 [Puccinia coronata f. sp. avenae]
MDPALSLEEVDLDLSTLPEDPEDTVVTLVQPNNRKEPAKATQQKNYTEKEDVPLCDSWLDVTQDPVVGTNQTGDGFWNRVTENYMKAFPNVPRTAVGLKSHWATIQGFINKFAGCLNQINNWNQSGTKNKDRLTYALRLYAKTYRKAFPHLTCYNILTAAPKWNEYFTALEQKSKSDASKQKQTCSTTSDVPSSTQSARGVSSEPSESTEAPSNAETSSTTNIKRPVGHKQAKMAQQTSSQTSLWQQSMATAADGRKNKEAE